MIFLRFVNWVLSKGYDYYDVMANRIAGIEIGSPIRDERSFNSPYKLSHLDDSPQYVAEL